MLSTALVLLLALLSSVSTTLAEQNFDEQYNVDKTTSMHRDATDTIPSNNEAPEQRRELFWSLVFISKCKTEELFRFMLIVIVSTSCTVFIHLTKFICSKI
jgi:hypothetical protein